MSFISVLSSLTIHTIEQESDLIFYSALFYGLFCIRSKKIVKLFVYVDKSSKNQ